MSSVMWTDRNSKLLVLLAALIAVGILSCSQGGGGGTSTQALAPPELDDHETLTASTTATITGRAQGTTHVEVLGSTGASLVPVSGSNFTAQVALAPNKVNHIYFTSIGAAGERSAPRSTAISHDAQPPSLFIDFPPARAQLTNDAVDVIGRVGDMLSGSTGRLEVEVNGQPAQVGIGNGANGTFLLPALTLVNGAPTVIEAVATDTLGNTVTKSISVTKVAIPPDSPRMEAVPGGNGQTAQVNEELSKKIEVKVSRGDGTGFEGKVVTFHVTRSDGRLAERQGGPGSMTLAVQADKDGVARAYWTLGSDSGSGNNRVEAISKDIAGTVFFCASAQARSASQINLGLGNNQKAQVNSPLPLPLSVRVTDGQNGADSVPVAFTVRSGGGAVDGRKTMIVPTDRTGMAQVRFTLGAAQGTQTVEANFPGNSGLPVVFTATGLAGDPDEPTSFTGLVQDNVGRSIGGVTCRLVVNSQQVGITTTEALSGQFEFLNAPPGPAELFVDGSTASSLMSPTGQLIPFHAFPGLHYENLLVVEHTNNSLPMPILLPELRAGNSRSYSTTTPTVLEIGEDPTRPDDVTRIEGLRFVVQPGSMTLANGQPAPDDEPIALNQVHFDDIPMPLPNGASSTFAWTLKPAGARFDPPIDITIPNMSGRPPGAIAEFLTFNHDTGRFEMVGTGHVSEDGSLIVSDPGSGLSLAGWGCWCPPPPPTAQVMFRDCADVASRNLQILAAAQLQLGLSKVREALDVQLSFENDVKPFVLTVLDLLDPIGTGVQIVVEVEACIVVGPEFWSDCLHLAIEDLRHGLMVPANLAQKLDTVQGLLGTARLASATAAEHLAQVSPLCEGAETTEPLQNALAELNASIATASTIRGHLTGLIPELQQKAVIVSNTRDALRLVLGLLLDAVLSNAINDGDPLTEALGLLEELKVEVPELVSVAIVVQDATDDLTATLMSVLLSYEQLVVVGSYQAYRLSAAGQMATMAPNGGYLLSNVPAGPAPVAVMAQCTVGGATLSGRSPFFPVPSNAIIEVTEPIPLSTGFAPLPPPVALTVEPVTLPLLDLESSTQLQIQVQGTLADGGHTFLSEQEHGTWYSSSNPLIAQAGVDGQISAISPGTAFITISNQGLTTVRRIEVVSGLATTKVQGFVMLPNGMTIPGATLQTSLPGEAQTSSAGGFFEFDLQIGKDGFISTRVLCEAEVAGQEMVGSTIVSPLVVNGISDAGIITLVPKCNSLPEWADVGDPGSLFAGDKVVSAMVVFDDGSGDALYVGGGIDGIPPLGLLKWNGAVWTRMTLQGHVQALAVFDDGTGKALFVGGVRLSENGVTADLWKWDGLNWTPVGSGNDESCNFSGSMCGVYALTVFDDDSGHALYAGGIFNAVNEVYSPGIARWDDNGWAAAGTGVSQPGYVRALAAWTNPAGEKQLFVGGEFQMAGSIPCKGVATWDGIAWSSPNPGTTPGMVTVYALAPFDDGSGGGSSIYATGAFSMLGGEAVSNIAQWDGKKWSPLGLGLVRLDANDCPPDGRSLAVFDDRTGNGPALYVGGRFGKAGTLLLSRSIARWDGANWYSLDGGLHGGQFCNGPGTVQALSMFDDGGFPALFVGGMGINSAGTSQLPIEGIARWRCP